MIRHRGQAGGVVDPPDPFFEGLEHGVEVHGGESGCVDGGEAGRNAGGPAQDDAEMGEVTAGADPGEERVLGRVMDAARARHVARAVAEPFGDRAHPGGDVGAGAEIRRTAKPTRWSLGQ